MRRVAASGLFLLLALPVACLLSTGCAFNRTIGRMQLVTMSERQEQALGERLFDALRRSPGISNRLESSDLVSRIGGRLAALAEPRSFPYRFFVLDSPEPNALALPGGYVLISRGMLALCNDENEIAGVLAHEMGHIAARHAAERSLVDGPAALIGRIVSKTASVFSDITAAELAERLVPKMLAPYHRRQEREADRLGAVICASAGYEPLGLARALLRREALIAYRRSESGAAGFAHPHVDERVAMLESWSAQLEVSSASAAIERREILLALDGLDMGPSRAAGVRGVGNLLVFPRESLVVGLPVEWVYQRQPGGHVAVAPHGLAVLSVEPEALSSEAAPVDEACVRRLASVESPAGVRVRRAASQCDVDERSATRFLWIRGASGSLELTLSATGVSLDEIAVREKSLISSIRPMRQEDLAGLSTARLRVARAEPGERVDQLAKRVGSSWDPREVAIMNGLSLTDTLPGDALIKVELRSTGPAERD